MISLLTALVFAKAHSIAQTHPQFLGAQDVLTRMATPPGGSALADPSVLLKNDLNSFGRRVAKMPDQEAATGWLALLHHNFGLTTNDTFGSHGSQISRVLAALPSPQTWPIIAQRIKNDGSLESSRRIALTLLFQVLQGDNAGAKATITKLASESSDAVDTYNLSEIQSRFATRLHDTDALEGALKSAPHAQAMRGGPWRDVSGLVPLLGVPRARELLTYFLLNDKAELAFDMPGNPYTDHTTAGLAREIAIAQVDHLAYPQWTLAESPDAGTLFERMKSRFPEITYGIADMNPMSWSTMQGAEDYCLINLFSAGRVMEAKQFGEKYADSLSLPIFGLGIHESGVDRLIESGKLPSFLDFLSDLAAAHPNSRLPDMYITMAQGNIDPARIETFLRRILANPKPLQNQAWLKDQLQTVLLEQGKLTEVANMTGGPSEAVRGSIGYNPGGLYEALGVELHRPDLIKRAETLREAAVNDDPDYARDEDQLAAVKRGQGPAIERRLIKNLRASMGQEGNQFPPPDAQAALKLMRFYALIGRYKDVVTLLDKFPLWNSPDIRGVTNAFDPDFDGAANALDHVGRQEEAMQIVRFELARAPDDDIAYAMLIEFDPAHAQEVLLRLASEYPLEAHADTYLAELSLKQGKLNAAERFARDAIDLNPQDLQGVFGHSTFHAQVVLAEVLKKEGKMAEARRLDSYSSVAETMQRADDLAKMNLVGPAIRLYRQLIAMAPELFEPQYQLGICEIRQGSMEEGRRDIAAACALLPVSCGREEWPPFVDTNTSRLAVFAMRDALEALVKNGTKNPTVFASLGALYRLDGDTESAIRCFRAAVEIDSNCLMAWMELSYLMDLISSDLAQRVESNCIRLGARQDDLPPVSVPDYAESWRQSAVAVRRWLDIPETVFTLQASHDELARSGNSAFENDLDSSYNQFEFDPPATRIANDPLIKAIGTILERG